MRLASLLFLMALPVAAQTPDIAARAAAERLEEAQIRMAEARGARDRVAALTQTVQAYEDGLTALRESLRQARARQALVMADLQGTRDETADLLGALQMIGLTPAPVQAAHPLGPLGSLRAGLLVADLTPELAAKADDLREQLAEIDKMRRLQQDAIAMLTDGLRGAQTARAALGLAISQRTDLPVRFQDDPIQTALLLASADTLTAFASRLADAVPDPDNQLAPTATLPLPVTGSVTQVADRPGIVILAPPRALVTAPVAATVLYRGPLLDFGNVVILEPGADVLFVIAGLAEVFGEPGEILSAGAPLGFLGGEQPGVDSILNQSDEIDAANGQQPLYLEVREGQTPTDPGFWFALDKE